MQNNNQKLPEVSVNSPRLLCAGTDIPIQHKRRLRAPIVVLQDRVSVFVLININKKTMKNINVQKTKPNIFLILDVLLTILILTYQDIIFLLSVFLTTALASLLWPTKNIQDSFIKRKSKIFFKLYLFIALATILNMSFVAMALILVISFIIKEIFAFTQLKASIRNNKKIISQQLSSGTPLPTAIENDFAELNINRKLNLATSTIQKISHNISSPNIKMGDLNIIEIYTSFLYWYVFKGNFGATPDNTDEEWLINASKNLKLKEKNDGYMLLYSKKI